MTRLPTLSTRDALTALQRGGFTVCRYSKHIVLKRGNCTVSVPQYRHEMKLSTLKRLLRYAGVSMAEFSAWREG